MSFEKAKRYLQDKGYGARVYLDVSLRNYDTVYPAAGDDHSAVRLTIEELEEISCAEGWVDVCKESSKMR